MEEGTLAQRLSRPERKALERAKKNRIARQKHRPSANHRKHNFAENAEFLQEAAGTGPYKLHSCAVTRLNHSNTTTNDVVRAIKRAQNLHDAHDLQTIERFLMDSVTMTTDNMNHDDSGKNITCEQDDTHAMDFYGYRVSLWARLAVAALHVERHDIARRSMQARRDEMEQVFSSPSTPMESAALIRGLLRVHNTTDALQLLQEELPIPEPWDNSSDDNGKVDQVALMDWQDKVKYRALALGSIASRSFFEDEAATAVWACCELVELGRLLTNSLQEESDVQDLEIPWARILRGAAKCETNRRQLRILSEQKTDPASSKPEIVSDGTRNDKDGAELPCNVVYAVLDAMLSFPSTARESDDADEVYETLAQALVRRVVFVTGAVSVDGFPIPDRGEAAFIGRSNVGKSSLVNMLTNRKALAYTSKRPGKTQQFNFFAVNDKPNREQEIKYGDVFPDQQKDADSFYLVDLPGFGYAKVPDWQRKQWSQLFSQYMVQRENLKVLFHLIDGRHGPTEEDATIMQQVASDLPNHVSYVIVLTKADKNVKGSNSSRGKVSASVMKDLQKAMEKTGVAHSPVVLSSAETRLGRDFLWKYLKRAAQV